ncbi:PQQ-binding-like beta-propeller repeat protein [Lentisphaera profundi]|uniref:PQQ-binding-like beta-propeller repeat protein n=1 Tax=Lentisphaera profundi TaxID=1658616 RepID=A0ABY7VT04_9BACT|nr:PQQ-binding-like beta-propeller repeat protein [Lentisphaera profundi]WDE97340.1 PQQ-binding-like beta-propeller repeat protein [Lentisphaera profundi]
MNHLSKVLIALFCLVTFNLHAERLVLVSASYGKNIVAICDKDGKAIWQYKTKGQKAGHDGHHDVQMLANGNILFHDSWTHILEVTLDNKIVWEYDSSKQNNKGHVQVHAFSRLANGNTMIVESGIGRIIHVDKEGKLLKEFPLKRGAHNTRWARMTKTGGYVVASEDFGVVEYDAEGKILWEYAIKGRVYGARKLKNGNTFICAGGANRILEVSAAKEVIWEINKKVPNSNIELGWMTCIQESEAGNYIVGNCHAGPNNPQIFEVDKNKKVIWEFNNFDLVGNGLACWEVLEGKKATQVRKQLEALKK